MFECRRYERPHWIETTMHTSGILRGCGVDGRSDGRYERDRPEPTARLRLKFTQRLLLDGRHVEQAAQ